MRTRVSPTRLRRGRGGREASIPHQSLRRPADDRRVEQALASVGLEDQGEVVDDLLRDRRSSGLPRTEGERHERQRH